MSIYHGKLLELIAVEKNNEKVYLHIKLSFEHEVELYWEIDGDTAENLLTLPEFDGKHKYRLSLHGKFDLFKQQCVSSITRTYLDTSEQINFACSVIYRNHLDSIKNAQSMDDLFELPFLSLNLSEVEENQTEPIIEQETEKKESIIPKRYHFPFKWVSVALISVISLILFGYTNNSSLNKTTFNDAPIVNAKVETVKNKLVKEKTVVVPVSTSNKDDSTQPLPPHLELDDSITYSLPKGYVSLTFDDGPSEYTTEIIDILKRYQAGGTFFFIGLNVKDYPEVVRYVQSNGYSIGSHSMNHVNMARLSSERQKEELLQSNKVIEEITNQEVVLLRPPFGALNQQTKNVTKHYSDKLILWNKDPKDWKTQDADKIFSYVRNTKASGSIILLHESQAVIDALPRIIEHLQKENLKIVSLR